MVETYYVRTWFVETEVLYCIIPQLQVVKEITYWLCCFPRYYCSVHLSIRKKSIALELIPLVRSFMPKKNYAQHCKRQIVICRDISFICLQTRFLCPAKLQQFFCTFYLPNCRTMTKIDFIKTCILWLQKNCATFTHVQYFCKRNAFSYKAIFLHSKLWLHLSKWLHTYVSYAWNITNW